MEHISMDGQEGMQQIKNQNRSKTIAKAYFFFWSLRGPGKLSRDNLCTKVIAFPVVFLFSEPQNEAPTSVQPKLFSKIQISIYESKITIQKKGHF